MSHGSLYRDWLLRRPWGRPSVEMPDRHRITGTLFQDGVLLAGRQIDSAGIVWDRDQIAQFREGGRHENTMQLSSARTEHISPDRQSRRGYSFIRSGRLVHRSGVGGTYFGGLNANRENLSRCRERQRNQSDAAAKLHVASNGTASAREIF
jgi:hypothetical protein